MNFTEEILQSLLARQNWTSEERNWLLNYLQKNDTPELRRIMLEKFSDDMDDETMLPSPLSEKMLQQIHGQINTVSETKKTTTIYLFRKLAAAAAIFIIIIGAGYFVMKKNKPKPVMAEVVLPSGDIKAPNTSNAVITLGNGQQVVLDSVGTGTLATQGNVKVIKTADGQILYNGVSSEVMYNTLSNPRGSRAVSLTLADGTRVWLNSESSLRYPTAFFGKERKVEITGEAYFEVAKNILQPFMVNIAGKETVQVLGTHFNINSYKDEADIKVTLLEGSVKVYIPSVQPKWTEVVIKPGQMASYAVGDELNGGIKIKSNVDVAAVVAWKNGLFNFDNADLQTVMRQLSRWYNVEVVFAAGIPKRTFGGEMQRDLNLSEVLKLLEKNNIHFTITGNKLIVKP